MKTEQIKDLVDETIVQLELAFGGSSYIDIQIIYKALLCKLKSNIHRATYDDFLEACECAKEYEIGFWNIELDKGDDRMEISYETTKAAKSRLVA